MPAVILENIRSAYNVGNIIRTADAFGFDVILSGYSPSPFEDESVKKTSLAAENSVNITKFWDPKKALNFAKQKYKYLIAAEITPDAKPITQMGNNFEDVAIILGNEISGALPESLEMVDGIFYIPMTGKKESLNVGQAAAIFMWEVGKKLNN